MDEIITHTQFEKKADQLGKCHLFPQRVIILLFAGALLLSHNVALANNSQKPLWELGVLGGYVSWPHYMGSDQRYSLPVAIPYVVYRGERLRVNRDGVRGLLWSGSRFALDLGLSFNPMVKSADSKARAGLPDLELSGEIGPRLLMLIYRSESEWQTVFRIPYRFVGDIKGSSSGWTMEPNILISSNADIGGVGGYLNFGLLYGSQKYNDTYYGVANIYQTSDRPAYTAPEGLHSLFTTIGLKFRATQDLSMGFYAKSRFLDVGVLKESPLVREPNDYSLGLWLAWSLWEHKQKASDGDPLSASDEDTF